MTDARLVAFVCDIGPEIGVGHAMRCMALSEEILRRGCRVVFVCDADQVPWVANRIRRLGVEVLTPPTDHVDLPRVFEAIGVDVVVFDSYILPAAVYEATSKAGFVTMAFVDGDARGASADLLLDQNLGAENLRPAGVGEGRRLAGINYAILRDDVLRLRPGTRPEPRTSGVPRLLAFFGGTDPFGVGPVVAQALVETGQPVDATFVAPTPARRAGIAELSPHPGQSVSVSGPSESLAAMIASSDVVVCAAGTSMWESFALGACVGLVCVADNQKQAYERVLSEGIGLGVGTLHEVKHDSSDARRALTRLLTEVPLRSRLAGAGWQMIDGRGKERVVDALLSLKGARAKPFSQEV